MEIPVYLSVHSIKISVKSQSLFHMHRIGVREE
jgi:hypothetical protein